jgi:hypothetical protein
MTSRLAGLMLPQSCKARGAGTQPQHRSVLASGDYVGLMIDYTYTSVRCHTATEVQLHLQEVAAQGWELVSANGETLAGGNIQQHYFYWRAAQHRQV